MFDKIGKASLRSHIAWQKNVKHRAFKLTYKPITCQQNFGTGPKLQFSQQEHGPLINSEQFALNRGGFYDDTGNFNFNQAAVPSSSDSLAVYQTYQNERNQNTAASTLASTSSQHTTTDKEHVLPENSEE